ncbi:MAG: alpha/beta hydrolase [Proteobacteria bacterium]|nr:alpha/beta hydrolase [Pseudomonadota bacterium]
MKNRACALIGLLGLVCLDLSAGTLDLTTCSLAGSSGYGTIEAQCGILLRPENPAQADGRQVELKVAVVKALSPKPRPDAITIINGGPGGSSIEMFADMAGAFTRMRRERDIVLIDQRGTGESNRLECPDLDEAAQGYGEAEIAESTRACLRALNADPAFYTTSVAVQDLEAMRVALGYEQLNVYGVSYGTRVALHYLRQYPSSVRTLVIDGVVPPTLSLGPDVALNAQATLDSIFERCAEDPGCHSAFPDLSGDFDQLARELKASPISIEVAHPNTGKIERLDLNYGHLAVTIRLLAYAPETSALIPIIITEASRRNFVPVASQAINVITQLSGSLAYGMHNAVVCTEDTPFYSHSMDWDALEQTYLGAEQVKVLQGICEVWPAGVIDPGMKDPVISDHPVLILSGEFDPITPPRYGEQVRQTLPNSLHIVVPGQGHGVIARGCVPGLASDFIDAASVADLDAGCVERLGSSPFFVDLLGPPP